MNKDLKTKIYIGGSLFTDKQINQRIKEEELLKENFKNIDIYNPITNDEINDKTKQPTATDIFLQDTKKVIESDIITADLDDIDEGLAMELGIAYGINYAVDKLVEICNKQVEQANKNEINFKTAFANMLAKMLTSYPKKTIFATYSDIRQDTKNEEGIYKSVGKNQYIIGGIEEMGKIYRHFENIVKDLKEKGVIK